MKRVPIMLLIVLSGSLAACSASTSDETDNSTQHETSDTGQIDKNSNASGQRNGENTTSEDEEAKPDERQDSEQSHEKAEDEDDKKSSEQDSAEEQSIEKEQKQMAINTLNGLVEDGKKGEVYHLNDGFYVGKTTQTEVYNTIGKPERQNTFDRYTGSMGQASYDLRYDENGLLVEARYLGTNVERQTNLGGITSTDLKEQLGEPDEKRTLKETHQNSYIYKLGKYEIQFILNEKDQADHVNLLAIN
ncbi:DUF4309 domain-containing protein [Sporosarcina jeotgali]|uniref:DUF4309 domain-containing protein n=1 Tax=Sporosarcina jeotgali TaxID=3020056 RepID=A0ABZ0KZ34_9BACL|nr:DUF4309 domain-containing protein [Sporosarcina sp. B2O-1]WOV85641.1 DUF4309 domain-containing protein [Sporosarcina sp. B2O-1]